MREAQAAPRDRARGSRAARHQAAARAFREAGPRPQDCPAREAIGRARAAAETLARSRGPARHQPPAGGGVLPLRMSNGRAVPLHHADHKQSASSAGLRYVTDGANGITRKRVGTGWAYYLPNGKRVTSADIRRRLNRLAIPPAWT